MLSLVSIVSVSRVGHSTFKRGHDSKLDKFDNCVSWNWLFNGIDR